LERSNARLSKSLCRIIALSYVYTCDIAAIIKFTFLHSFFFKKNIFSFSKILAQIILIRKQVFNAKTEAVDGLAKAAVRATLEGVNKLTGN
jgi:hypothetical protein